MNLYDRLQLLILQNGYDTEEFCLRFGVHAISELPLVFLHEIARALNTTPEAILLGKAQRKPFPTDIKLLILDVDGVMTDGGMYFSDGGEQLKKFNTKDGMGIIHLTRSGFQVGIISSGFKGEMVRTRAEMLGIQHFYLGRGQKLDVLTEWCAKLGISLHQVAMIGDDVNDLAVMKSIGYTAAPADAVHAVKLQVDCILNSKGGEGCIREFIEDVMQVHVEY
jgi:YrbI family 3-deoxy-D-manno-octulosonate 8-phosphate phosphatase